jgi:uncharacterized membrane protein
VDLSKEESMSTNPQAKQPKSALAGPYGHPFHPVLVTVPIGSWVAALVFDIVALASDDKGSTFAEGAYWLIGIGIVGAVVAAVFGLLDLLTIPRGTRAFTTGITHMTLNLIVVALFIVNYIIRAAQDTRDATVLGLVLTLIALAVLGASGWLGGKLAYTYGVRVADESTQSEGFTS